MKIDLPVIIDNTIVSNFGNVNRFDILENLYAGNIVIPHAVMTECVMVEKLISHVRDAIDEGWLEVYTLEYGKSNDELIEFVKLRKRFGYGECAVMAIAKSWECTVASDDMRAVRKFCLNNSVTLIGTLGILYQAYNQGFLTEVEAESLLQRMMNTYSYNPPVKDFTDVVNHFRDGYGKKLY